MIPSPKRGSKNLEDIKLIEKLEETSKSIFISDDGELESGLYAGKNTSKTSKRHDSIGIALEYRSKHMNSINSQFSPSGSLLPNQGGRGQSRRPRDSSLDSSQLGVERRYHHDSTASKNNTVPAIEMYSQIEPTQSIDEESFFFENEPYSMPVNQVRGNLS